LLDTSIATLLNCFGANPLQDDGNVTYISELSSDQELLQAPNFYQTLQQGRY